MSKISNINKTHQINPEFMPIVELKGVRVITTETLATGYGTAEGNIRKNLSLNKTRFKEGVHFFNLEGEELADLRVTNSNAQISSNVVFPKMGKNSKRGVPSRNRPSYRDGETLFFKQPPFLSPCKTQGIFIHRFN